MMNPAQLNTPDTMIPQSLLPYFQEYDFTRLAIDPHADLIIERTLNYGNLDELRWLFRQYDRSRISNWVMEMGDWRLSRRRFRLWCVLLGIVPSQIENQRKSNIFGVSKIQLAFKLGLLCVNQLSDRL